MQDDPRRGFFMSLVYAGDGVLRTLCSQRNMKVHWVSGLAVMLVGMALPLDIAARATMMFCVFMVLAMEVLNTALEAFVDLHIKAYARSALVAKDAAAAAVLIFAVGAVVVFTDVLVHRWDIVEANTQAVWRTVAAGVPMLIVVGLMLSGPRNLAAILVLGVVGAGLFAYLASFSQDRVFSLGALTFLFCAVFARVREPALIESS